jgi:hypothetical protein
VKNRAIGYIFFVSLALTLAALPQQKAQAKTCYDSGKPPQEIPCTKSNYIMTQQARKNIPPSPTPVPETDTPVPTATDTPTNTPTITPSPTNTTSPTATQLAAPPIVPAKASTQPNACDARLWPATAGILNLIPCSGWVAVTGVSLAAGLVTVMIALVLRQAGQGGVRRYFSGRVDVTGDERLARKMDDDFDEDK